MRARGQDRVRRFFCDGSDLSTGPANQRSVAELAPVYWGDTFVSSAKATEAQSRHAAFLSLPEEITRVI